jgi:transposase
MQTYVKVKNFSGQKLYVGIDTHKSSWKVSIYSDEFELKTFSQNPDPDALVKYLTKQFPGAEFQCAYEAGFAGFWIQKRLTELGVKCIVVHPADVPTSDKESRRKSDSVDCRKLARGLKNNELTEVFIPSIQQQQDRSLIRGRQKIVKDQTRVKNRIKSFLKFFGITVPELFNEGQWNKGFIQWLKDLCWEEESAKICIQTYIDELEFLIEKEKHFTKKIKVLSESSLYKENVDLLTSIPSIGLISAMTLLTEIGDINRFKSTKELSSYFGLTPNCRSSGDSEWVGGLTKRGNIFIKTVIIECTWVAVRKDPALLLYYKKQLVKMNGNKAIIRVARKLVNRIRFVLVNKIPYQTGIGIE